MGNSKPVEPVNQNCLMTAVKSFRYFLNLAKLADCFISFGVMFHKFIPRKIRAWNTSLIFFWTLFQLVHYLIQWKYSMLKMCLVKWFVIIFTNLFQVVRIFLCNTKVNTTLDKLWTKFFMFRSISADQIFFSKTEPYFIK